MHSAIISMLDVNKVLKRSYVFYMNDNQYTIIK